MSKSEKFLFSLMQILRILASPAEIQIDYLRSLGEASVDELGLEYEEFWLMANAYLDSDVIEGYQYDELKKLNDLLDTLKENAWTEEALVNDVEWESIRKKANDCIVSLSNS